MLGPAWAGAGEPSVLKVWGGGKHAILCDRRGVGILVWFKPLSISKWAEGGGSGQSVGAVGTHTQGAGLM